MIPDWTVCVLLYGDHTDLHRRCLDRINQAARTSKVSIELRIGLNAVCANTQTYLTDKFVQTDHSRPFVTHLYDSRENICKYPMMRRMLYDDGPALRAPWIAWFDDDSYIKDPECWFNFLQNAVNENPWDYVGALYSMPLTVNRWRWFKKQPWAKKPNEIKRVQPFMQGGWWCLKTKLLQEVNYPFPGLTHRGGDVALGCCAQQQGWKMGRWKHEVAINADEFGNESKAAHRGEWSPRSWGDDYMGS